MYTKFQLRMDKSKYLLVVLSDMAMIHAASLLISRELNGRTRTATLTDDMMIWVL